MRIRALALCALLAPAALPAGAQPAAPAADGGWRRGGTCYEIFVRSFADSDGDGVGDLRGLTERLDYVNDGDPASRGDLGAQCVWLMPVAQSPSYHGYDVTNYYAVNREYGTEADFKEFVAQAHRRGIRVLVDLVLNHSSSEHPFFKQALQDPASPYRDWYVWAPQPGRTRGWTVPTWHKAPDRDEYYYGLFWGGMPDLRLDHPPVRAEAERIARFWLEEMGVDGFRLDAVGHFFERGEEPAHGPGTHEWLRGYVAALKQVRPDVYTVGEVWDSIGAIRPYYPDQLEAYFAFEVSDALLDAVRTGERARLVAAVERVQRELPPGRYATFQRNHDQTRTMTVLGGDAARARLAATLLLTLPGLPFVYYGEEIGMTADKPDPRLRTPMHWRRAPAAGFTTGTPWEPLRPDSLTANVEAHEADPASLLHHYRTLVHLRAATPPLGSDGEFVALEAPDPAALAYLRRLDGRTVLVVANLGERPLSRAAFSLPAGTLASGRWRAAPLLGDAPAATLRAGAGGRVEGWVPVPALAPHAAHVFELSPQG